MSDQEARDFGISTDRVCLEIEQNLFDADDVLRHTATVDFSGQLCTSPGTCPPPRNSRAASRPALLPGRCC
ncbi:hypothetical protein GCM10020295_00850 [Streptomyces cinereospinus]